MFYKTDETCIDESCILQRLPDSDHRRVRGRLAGGSPLQLALLARAYGRAGQREEAVRVLSRVKALPRETYVMPYWTALAYEGINDKDQALRCLSEGYVTRAAWMTYLKVDPRWDNLRSDSRFDELVRKINFPEA
jgi:hypothetical protein